jgi:polysaccharide pyruvyl transferase WcaK-like protein
LVRVSASLESNRQFRIALFGAFGLGNFGNDATLDACMAMLCPPLPRSRIVSIAANPAQVSRKHGIAARRLTNARRFGRLIDELSNLFHAWRILRRVQTLVIAGTGVLDDQHVRTHELPLEVLRWSLAARLAGAKLVFLSVGAGPIDQAWSRRFLKTAVALAHEVSYRDRRSMDFMRSIGRDVRRDRIVPDLVLSFDPPDVTRASVSRERTVAIGVVSRLNWHDRHGQYSRYENRIVQLIQRLAADGRQILVVTGDERDVDTQEAIMRRAELSGLSVRATQCNSFDDVLQVVGACDVMFASRYHNLVAAVIAGIPVISLGYGPKNEALLEQLDILQWSHDIDAFAVDDLMLHVQEAMSRETPMFRPALDAYRRSLREEFDRLTHG